MAITKERGYAAQEMMLADDGHCHPSITEADRVMTQNAYDGDPMERRDPSSSALKSESATNTDHNDESDEEMLTRTIRWFRFSVIDTGIG